MIGGGKGALSVTWIRCCLLEQPESGFESNILGPAALLRPISLQRWQLNRVFNAVYLFLAKLICAYMWEKRAPEIMQVNISKFLHMKAHM